MNVALHPQPPVRNILSLCAGVGGLMTACEHCGANVPRDQRGRIKRFCDRSCASSHREHRSRLARQQFCDQCGKPYDRPWGEKRRGRFCSRPCFANSLRKAETPPNVIANRKMAVAACALLRRALKHKGARKAGRLFEELGFTPSQLRKHLEAQFEPGMSWDNYGRHGWHVDHIKPISTFPKAASLREINSLSNLRPLWEHENCGRRNCG